MQKSILHITNGSVLTSYLQELGIKGDTITWQEMLCEGPTTKMIDSDEFYTMRKHFLVMDYGINIEDYNFKENLNALNHLEKYSQIILWFEYDLFCHINMCAAIALLQQKSNTLPVYLVCSGRIPGEKWFKALTELSEELLLEHYANKVLLNSKDLELASYAWDIYCGKDHNLFKSLIVKPSSFLYLSNCLKAHLKRFPDSRNGLSTLEFNILKRIQETKDIKSTHHLLGYTLSYQGYYGFGDWQIARIIKRLEVFFDQQDGVLKLNRNGHEALIGTHNFAQEVNDNSTYGGINRLRYQFNRTENKLIKTVINANTSI